MRAIHVGVHVAPVRVTLNHGDHGNCLRLLKFFVHSLFVQSILVSALVANVAVGKVSDMFLTEEGRTRYSTIIFMERF